jgi:hypothetical protein
MGDFAASPEGTATPEQDQRLERRQTEASKQAFGMETSANFQTL